MLAPGEVVIVSGSPGSGKTTISAVLANGAERSVHLESDWFYRFIRSGLVPPHLPASHAQNTAVMDIVTDVAAGYADAGYAVVWDGIVGPWFLDRVVRRLAAQGIAVRYLVLRADTAVALERVRARDGTTDASGAAAMADQFADLGEFETHAVAANGTVDEVVARCRRALAERGLGAAADARVDDRWPVSIKGVLAWGDEVVVLANRRGEWELPGGRLDADDAGHADALRREFREELGIDVAVGALIDSWIYDVEGKRVVIITYACTAPAPTPLVHSDEHVDVARFTLDELRAEAIPAGYLRSIERALSSRR